MYFNTHIFNEGEKTRIRPCWNSEFQQGLEFALKENSFALHIMAGEKAQKPISC